MVDLTLRNYSRNLTTLVFGAKTQFFAQITCAQIVPSIKILEHQKFSIFIFAKNSSVAKNDLHTTSSDFE